MEPENGGPPGRGDSLWGSHHFQVPAVSFSGAILVHQAVGTNHQLVEKIEILLMAEILHQLICNLSHYLQGFIDPRWCRISAINSMYINLQDFPGFFRYIFGMPLFCVMNLFSWLQGLFGSGDFLLHFFSKGLGYFFQQLQSSFLRKSIWVLKSFMVDICWYIDIYIYLEPNLPLFLKINTPQNKAFF